jgi:hypothetical protein
MTSSLYLTSKINAILSSYTSILTPSNLPTFTYSVTNSSITLNFQPVQNATYAYSLDNGYTYAAITTITSVLPDGTLVYTITGLTAGANYILRLLVNSVASTSQSITLSSNSAQGGGIIQINQGPTIVSVTPGNASAVINFTIADNTATNVQYSLDGGVNYTLMNTVTSPYTISNLVNGNSYSVVIQSVSSAGASFQSNTVSFVPSTVPSQPSLSVSASNQSAILTFSDANNGGLSITKYQYSFDTTTFVDMGLTSPYTISSLTNGTTYSLVIRAVNYNGNSNNSNSVYFTPSTNPSPPSISVTPGNGSVSVSFTAGANNGSAITNYRYSLDGGATYVNMNTTTSPYTITGLTNGTQYSIQLDCINANGQDSLDTTSVFFTPSTIASTPSFSATSTSSTILITFTAPSSNGGSAITNYLYSTDNGTTFTSMGTTTSPYTVTGLSGNTTYQVQIKAVNANGNSAPTASQNITTTASYPIDTLSTSAKTAMIYSGATKSAGAFGVRLLYSSYTGAIMQIKRSSDNVIQDFYGDINGNLTTASGSGTSITTWLSGATAYVVKWYDQTGNSNHGTATGTPIYNTSTQTVSFASGYFSIPNSAYPTGNSAYSYIYTPNNYSAATNQGIHSGGATNNFQECLTFLNTGTKAITNSWWGDGLTDNSNNSLAGTKIAEVYDGTVNKTGRVFYYNNSLYSNASYGAYGGGNTRTDTRAQTSTSNYLGYFSFSGFVQYNGTLQFFYWAPINLTVSDLTILCNT